MVTPWGPSYLAGEVPATILEAKGREKRQGPNARDERCPECIRAMLNSYPWYVDDWLYSETRRSLNYAERGIYRDLLDHCFLEGSLPGDRELIWRCLEGDRRGFGAHLDHVLKLFTRNPEDGRYYHPKVTEIRAKLLCYHESRKHGGFASGRSRRSRKTEHVLDSVQAYPPPAPAPSSSPTPSAACSPSAPPAPTNPPNDVEAAAGRMYAAHPKQKHWGLVTPSLESALKLKDCPPLAEIEARHAAWCKDPNWTKESSRFAPQLHKWIEDRGYLSYPKSGPVFVPRNIHEARAGRPLRLPPGYETEAKVG